MLWFTAISLPSCHHGASEFVDLKVPSAMMINYGRAGCILTLKTVESIRILRHSALKVEKLELQLRLTNKNSQPELNRTAD